MKHLTTADTSLLVGDEAADTLLHYAAHLARLGSGDDIQLRALNTDGGEITATFLLNSGSSLMAESTASVLPEPDNDEVITYMLTKLQSFDVGPSPFGQEPHVGEE